MTRAHFKRLEDTNTQNGFSTHWDRTDHPGIVELLKRPKDGIELKFVSNANFDMLIYKRNGKELIFCTEKK